MKKQTFKTWQSSLPLTAIALVFLLGAFDSAFAQNSAKLPVLKDKLIGVLQKKVLTNAQIIEVIETNGVNFQLTGEVESELRKAGASEAVVRAVKENYHPVAAAALTQSTQAEPQPSQVETLFNQGLEYN